MIDILLSFGSPFRAIAIMLDSVAYSLIDNAYNLIVTFSSGSLFNDDVISSVMNNTYVIIGIFALFRIALLLVNAMINPDKLNEKGNGLGNVLANLIIMFVLLIMTPIIFKEAFSLQETIVKGHYIEKIFLNVGSIEEVDPGDTMRSIAIGSLITINEEAEKSSNCTTNCKKAIEAYNDMKEKNNFKFSTLAKYIGVTIKDDLGNTIYVYDYMFVITFVCGIAITYVLLSFGLDIAIRMVELAALEMLSPLFIATYIDPKSAKTGPFHKWLTTVGKTYASLFIKLAILSLMLLFISLIRNNINSNLDLNAFENLVMLFAILIFAKKAPKWIGGMIGVDGEGSGLGGLGIGKKLGEAALVGGALSKGLESAKKFTGQKGKNFLANRARNTAARIGGMKEAHADNKRLKQNGVTGEAYKNEKKSLWKQGRAAATRSRNENWGKDSQGLIKDISSGYMSGRKNVNEEAQTFNEKMKLKAEAKADKINAKAGNSAAARAKAIEIAANNKEARKLYGDVEIQADGDRAKINGVYLNPRGAKEMNQAFNTPVSENSAYEAFGKNLAESKGYEVDATGKVIDKTSGKVISNSAAEYGASNMTYKGRLAVKQLVADNVQRDFTNYENSVKQKTSCATTYTEEITKLQSIRSNLQSNVEYTNAQAIISKYNDTVQTKENLRNEILDLKNNSDFQRLSSANYSSLSPEEQNRLASYNLKEKELVEKVNKVNTEIKSNEAKCNVAMTIVQNTESQYGIAQIEANIAKSKEQLDAWDAEVKNYENKFKNTSAIVFDDEGKIKTNDDGSVTKENPYTVKVNGEKLNPVKNITRIEDIKNAYSMNASKAKSKYEEAMKDNSE